MTIRVVYKPDKSVAIIHPAPKSRRKGETEEQWLERVFSKAMQGKLKNLPYDDVDISTLPQSREDRDAWEGEKGKGITVNQVKAQEIKDQKTRNQLIEDEKRVILESQAINSLKIKGLIK